MMNSNCKCNNNMWLLAGLGLGLLAFVIVNEVHKAQQKPVTKQVVKSSNNVQSIIQSVTGETHEQVSDGAPVTSYKNLEEWQIEWSSDGLPTKVIVHRDAKQS